MYHDANNVASPLWVRLSRTAVCFAVAALLAWRGARYDSPNDSAAVPFVMCQLTAVVLSVLGLFSLDRSDDIGPS
jgi:hypothetical protein